MKCLPFAGGLALLLALALASAATATAKDAFERIDPRAAGYDPAKLEALRALLEARGSESMLLLKDGKVFFEYGDIRARRLVHSIRKPLLHALIGIEQARGGCLALDRRLSEFDVDEAPPGLSATELSATLAQVLQSRSGVYHPAAAETEGMAAARPARGSHAPGTHFYYNNWDFNVAGAIYEQCSGVGVHEAFLEQIARPLGMLDYRGRIYAWPGDEAPIPADADGFRRLEPGMSRHRAWHFRLSAHDLALFGQLYLQGGRWQGRQQVPAAWIDAGTQPISLIEPEYGLAYGILWNVLVPGAGETRPAFYHTGLGVHMLGVYPAHGLVIVHRVDTERAFTFNDGDLYAVIRAMHAARLRPAGDPRNPP